MSKIVGILGEKFSGKDTSANYIAQKYNATHVRFSHPLDEILNSLNLPISRRNEIDLGKGLRQTFGETVLVNAIVHRVKNAPTEMVVVNGIRYDELDAIKNLGAKIIYITAPAEIRFQRYQQRHEKTDDSVMDFEQFKSQEQEWTERDIPALGKQADFKIENIGSPEDLYYKLDEIVGKI